MPDLVVPDTELACPMRLLQKLLLASSIVFNFYCVTGSKKCFSSPCFKRSCINVLFRVSPSSSDRRMYFFISSETRAPYARQYNFSLPAIFHGSIKCDIASMIFFTAHSLFFIWDDPRSRCLPVFGHSGSSIMSHIFSISSKSFALDKVFRAQRWYTS